MSSLVQSGSESPSIDRPGNGSIKIFTQLSSKVQVKIV
jgi:hypothetical protein